MNWALFWMFVSAAGFTVSAIGYVREARRAAREAYRGAIRKEFE